MASAAASTQPAEPQRWLYGPSVDLLLGCGGLYAVAVGLLYFTVIGRITVQWGFLVSMLLALFINGPHYGATLLRVYEQREERRKYAFFAVYVTLALCVLFLAGLHVTWIGSLLLTIYFTWTPWHFSGQNYGLAVLFLRRRGIDVSARAKRTLYLSFVLSCVVTLLALHGEFPQLGLAPVPSTDGTAFRFLSLGIPDAIRMPLLVGSFVAYLAALVAAFALLLRRASAADLVPTACLVLAQAAWFALPALLAVESAGLRNIAFSTIWIALAHSIQYLWVTSYFASHTGHSASLPGFLVRCVAAGAAVIVLPAVLLAPDALGPLPYDAGLGVLLFSVINLHHFILDGAIWKLRDGRIARVLIRRAEPTIEPTEETSRPWFKVALIAAGCVAVSIEVAAVIERDFGVDRALVRGEVSRVAIAAKRLDRLGRESARLEAQLATAIANRGGSLESVQSRLERSLELRPDADTWHALGVIRLRSKQPEAAASAFRAALELEPDHLEALRLSAHAEAAADRPDAALEALRQARERAPETPEDRRLRRRLEARTPSSPVSPNS